MNDQKIIVIFTYSPFPFGEAASNRIFSLALCFQNAGYKVIVLSNGPERTCDFDENKKAYIYKDIEYRNFSNISHNRLLRIYSRNNIFEILKTRLSQKELDRTKFLYSTYRNYGLILHYALKLYFKIPALVDVTEWHSRSQYKNGIFNPNYLLHNIKIRSLIPKAGNIICITTFLENFFKEKKCNTVVIPPQVDTNNFAEHQLPEIPPIRIFYAGTSAKKDYIDVALEGLCLLSQEELKNIKCTLVGQSINDFHKQFPRSEFYIEYLKGSLEILDRMPKPEIDKKLSGEHFLILMRPDSRYSKAGFPSKVPEALAAGVPIITNITSDLGHYIKDGENGLIVDEFTPESFSSTIKRTLTIQNPEFMIMSRKSKETAKKYFNFDVYSSKILDFLNRTGR